MKAIVIDHCCRAEELHVAEIPMPQARPGWVVVKIYAIGLNHSESLLRQFEADQPHINTPVVPGIECAGEVWDASDSQRLHNGDRVVALMGGMGRSFNGSYEEYALLPESHVFRVKSRLDWLSLAAVPETFFTAYGSLRDCLLIDKDDRLLVRGATSTVGRAAIQLGKAMGATVIAACRRESAFAEMHRLGADHCIIDDGAIATQMCEPRPNKLLELVGPRTLQDSLRCVSTPGYVCNTGILGNQFTVPQFDPIKYIPNGVFLSGFFSNYPTQELMDELFELIDRHQIVPDYARVLPLERMPEAHQMLDNGTAGGKIIITIADQFPTP